MSGMLALWLAACRSTTDTSTPTDTRHSGTEPALYPPADAVWTMEGFGYGQASYLGRSLAAHAEGPVLGAPSQFGEEGGTPYVFLPSTPFTSGKPQDDWFRFENASTWDEFEDSHQLGTEVLAPGDVTGDGVDDLVAFDDFGLRAVPSGFLVPGPLGERWARADDPDVLPLFGPRRGAPCGDVTGDGHVDLCLDTGVMAGPLLAPASPTVTWSAFDPKEARIAAGDLDGDGRNELVVWDRAASALRVLTTFPPGDHDLATLATRSIAAPTGGTVSALETGGDLDGDGREDLVVAWVSDQAEDRVWIVTDPSTTSLDSAWATWEGAANALALGDLDGDGADDLVLGGEVMISGLYSGDPTVSVLLGPLHPGRLNQEDVAITWLGTTEDDLMSPDGLGYSIELGDVDADGQDDLLIGAPWEREVSKGKVYLTLGPWSP